MIIVSLQVENVKRIKAVDMTPEGELVIIGGDNAQGKTSLMDAISYAIGGKKLIPAKPIREGAKKASVKVDLGDLKIERTFWYNSKDGSLESKVIVTEAEPSGRPPQGILDTLFSSLSFDPLAFSRMDKAHQLVTAKEVLGLDLDQIEAEITRVFELRKSLKQTFQSEDARLRNLEHYPDAPKEEIDVAALTAAARAIDSANVSRETAIHVVEDNKSHRAATEAEVQAARKRIKELESGIEKLTASIKQDEKNIPEEQDSSSLWKQIESASSINQQVRDNAAYIGQESTVKEAGHQLEVAEGALEEKRETRISMIESADFPIDGLSLDANGVIYNSIPFDQASSAEQLRVSVAMGFAMNPNLKVILIRDGSLLDDTNLAMIREMAKEAEAQVWVERVGKDKQASVIIEDGQIKEAE